MNIHLDAQLLIETHKTGIGRTAQYIVESLVKNHKNNIYTLNCFALFYPSEKRKQLNRFFMLGCNPNECGWFNASAYKLLYSFIPVPYSWFFGKNADVTHFFNYHVPPGVKGKVVTTVYDMVYKAYPGTMNCKTRYMLDMNMVRSCKRADIIVTISNFSKNEIIKYLDIPAGKIAVMPCGVDMKQFRPSYSENEIRHVKVKYGIDSEYFLFLGTLEPRKNIERLVEAYYIVKKCVKDAPKLVIAGKKGWLYESIFQKVQDLRLNGDVLFTGYVDNEDTPKLMRGAFAFVFPSLYEGFGLPPLEAMACGTPVITSNSSSLPEVVGDAAILSDPYSVESISEAMVQVIEDSTFRSQLSKRGLERVKSFTWDNSARIISEIYEFLARSQ